MSTNSQILEQNQNTPLNNDVIDLLPLIKLVWRRKWRIISLVFVVMLLTALVVMSIAPTYQASATMQIEEKGSNVVSIEQVYGLDGGSSEYLQTQFELLKSRALAESVVKDLNLTTHKEFDPSQQEPPLIDIKGWLKDLNVKKLIPGVTPEELEAEPLPTEQEILDGVVQSFMKKVSISPIKKSQLVVIKVDMTDPVMAAKAANKLGENFINSQLDAAMQASITASTWMNSRLEELKINLQKSENKLQAFKEKEGLIDVDGIVTVSANELSAINQRLVDARSKRAEAESQYRQVRTIKKNDWQKLSSVPAVLSNPLIQTFKAEEARAKAKVEELSKRYGKRHPAMQAALSDLNAAQASLKSQVAQIVAGIKRKYQIAAANEYSLKSSVKENKEQIKDISKNEFKLRELQREVDSNQAIFDTFMTRLKETTATSDLNTTNARIVDPAVVPNEPIKPKKPLIVILAGLLTGLLAVFLTLLFNALNNTFKTSDEVEQKLNLPVLGILPYIKHTSKDQKVALTFHKNSDKIFTESVRTIRTSVMLSSIESLHKVVVVTSSVPGEGKSTVSINLADAISQMENTLLIEADMRRPTMSKILGLPPGTPGLANLIAGSNTFEDCVKSLYGGIDTIVAGVVPPNPLELLASDRFKEILTDLSTKYERIIIDSPPIQAVSDSIVLSTYADSVIYVVKSDDTKTQTVVKGVGKLLQNNAPIRGVILNQVDIKKAKKQGYSYEGYYDYYGYSDPKSKKA
ncbi:GumC family protein [Thiomicrorhabdus sp. Milos-T2]|uniref:GumC family protein n=1 Tax=Thiomicrorhabdus sp. Milos-T2 TaxID=90814 RepID=UPI000494B6F6|nr:polysaccharide biosynthesis tyrosine autokinase [Thiomicrorhabdus sp. Milos-T2]